MFDVLIVKFDDKSNVFNRFSFSTGNNLCGLPWKMWYFQVQLAQFLAITALGEGHPIWKIKHTLFYLLSLTWRLKLVLYSNFSLEFRLSNFRVYSFFCPILQHKETHLVSQVLKLFSKLSCFFSVLVSAGPMDRNRRLRMASLLSRFVYCIN